MSRSKPAAWLWIAATLLLIVCGWISTALCASGDSATFPTARDWVRTRDGWERANWHSHTRYEPALHPLTVGSFLGMAAMWVLLVFPSERRR